MRLVERGDPSVGGFQQQALGELQGVLLRYEWPETTTTAELPTPRQGGARILLAWSAGGGAVPAAEHQRAIAAACQAGFHPVDPARDVLPQFSLGRLRGAGRGEKGQPADRSAAPSSSRQQSGQHVRAGDR